MTESFIYDHICTPCGPGFYPAEVSILRAAA